MLINDDSKGTSDGKEKNQLQAMIAVGSEFMTYRDDESTVQRSGEFVRIEKESGESQPRFVLLHETAMAYREENNALHDLTGNELRSIGANVKLRKRSRLYMSEIDSTNGDLPFREIGGFKSMTRISRHHGFGTSPTGRTFPSVSEANYTAQAGKRRLWPKGDGKLWLVREVVFPGDARYFNDSMRALVSDPIPHTKKRGLRAARVEVVELNPINGSTSAPTLSFDVHSGLNYDPTPRSFSDSIRPTDLMYSDTVNYAAFTGVFFGSSLNLSSVDDLPNGGDASDTYAVCEPALAKHPDGREYTSIIAVYPAPEDVYDARGSGPYRLTVKRTTVGGGVALGKINFPALPSLPLHYLAARGMSMVRLGPNTVVLRVYAHLMQYGAGGSLQASRSDAFFMWTTNNGETWTYVPPSVGYHGVGPYGGMLVRDKDTLLTFGWYKTFGAVGIEVHRVTTAGTVLHANIPSAVFGQGLVAPVLGGYFVPYLPIGFGGVVYRKTAEGKKKRLWMQFEPYYGYAEDQVTGGTPINITYPGSRPMLIVSDDGGLTWQRRLLPTPWSFRVGFVVSIDEKTLAVPVLSARKEYGAIIQATIYTSNNGGDSWKASNAKISLPSETWADGQIVVGGQYWHPVRNEFRYEQDLSDSAQQYNRGELYPMLTLRDADGKLLPSNPARPWMADYRFKEPTYG